MPNFLHRTTKQYLISSSPASLTESIANYIQDPDLSAVTGQPSKYWIITGDIVTLMDAGAMAAVDAAVLTATRDAVTAQLDQTEDVLRAFMLTVLDEINILRGQHALSNRTVVQLRTAVRNKLGT